MKKILIFIAVIAAFSILAGCKNEAQGPAIEPAEGKLTFVFFYTNG